ncbi:SH3 domain-containing protein [Elizabethkingia anophelis]|uniref:SH3 domain-containing protein n=1 Tax=Elizabethkingia anophelis TaxID=1117645 RepID=UPI00301CB986
MKTILSIMSLLFYSTVMAQFAKIVDKDGYVNVRNDANNQSKIVGKIASGEVVYIFNHGDEFGNWLIVDYHTKNGDLLTGYVHNSRVKPLSSYETIPVAVEEKYKATFILKNIQVTIKTQKFDYEKNKNHFKTYQYPKYPFEIYKGQEVWGTDRTIPDTQYQSIQVAIDGKETTIPQKEIESLFNPNLELTECFYDNKTETLFIACTNADGAGAYQLLVVIQKGKYAGRHIYQAN